MPFALRENPLALLPDDLDDYWSRGWFRMRQTLFTTHFLEFEDHFYSAVWLRVHLTDWEPEAAFRVLQKRNKAFRADFRPAAPVPAEDLENLFTHYRDSLDIDVAPSLADLLVGHETASVFDSWELRLYDGESLIAAGVFDLGLSAAGGITSFYDPAYKKHSLGKYLIYLKMAFCKEKGLEWFYPGYFVPGRPRFDYKLSMGTSQLEYLDLGTGAWLPFRPHEPRPDPLATMQEQLSKVGSPLWFNGHLSIHLSPQVQGVELFDFPVFLSVLPPSEGSAHLFVVFDPRDTLYHLIHARAVYQIPNPEIRSGIFDSALLQVERLLFSTESSQEMMAAVGFVTA